MAKEKDYAPLVGKSELEKEKHDYNLIHMSKTSTAGLPAEPVTGTFACGPEDEVY